MDVANLLPNMYLYWHLYDNHVIVAVSYISPSIYDYKDTIMYHKNKKTCIYIYICMKTYMTVAKYK